MLGFNKCVGCWKKIDGNRTAAEKRGWYRLTLRQYEGSGKKYTAMVCPECTKVLLNKHFFGGGENDR